ncbi:MAG: GGDEF domain-containing protein [Spirochaetes bacterium]|nr:GGDEF domain-containing protein [Spirochaetota bacterium]
MKVPLIFFMSAQNTTEDLFYYLYYLDLRKRLIPRQKYLIGRDSHCDIILPDKAVSRQHALIFWKNQQFMIKDLDSLNKVIIDSQAYKEKVLFDKDKIKLGNLFLEFRIKEKKITDTDSISSTLIMENKLAKILNQVKDEQIINKLFDLKEYINKSKSRLYEQVIKDELTGLYNRRYFDEMIVKESDRAHRYQRELVLIMIDIDHFKKFNDTHGHQKGDEVLQTVANIISENIRKNDMAARYGGEEMSIIMPETNIEQGKTAAEKIRVKVMEESLSRTGLQVTISLGVAHYSQTTANSHNLIKTADHALYQAKNNGRNCTVYQV